MKKVFTVLTLACFGLSTNAAVLTVSNNINSPGQYTDAQVAIDASSPNDTILLHGSATSYGNIDLNWPLTIMGAGYNNPYGENTTVSSITLKRANASISSSGSRIIGVILGLISSSPGYSGGAALTQVLEDVVIERCQIGRVIFSNACTFNNVIVKNCYFSGGTSFTFNGATFINSNYTYYSGIRIINNIFSSNGSPTLYSAGSNLSNVYFKNNIFLNGGSALFGNASNVSLPQMVLENNIFYGVWPEGCRMCAFDNNITYSCNDDQLVYAGNPGSVGSGNIVGQNPSFVTYPVLGGAFDYAHDYNLQAGSPGIDAGTDGSDIGIYGGAAPFVNPGTNPTIPQMMYVEFQGPSSVGLGGTLDVQFRSHRQD
jgi:hypothetical protein